MIRGVDWTKYLYVGWFREAFAVAFFDTAHGSEQMVIGAGPKCLRLAIQELHHERIEDADLLQCRQVAMDAREGSVEAVKKIVDEGFRYVARVFWCADKICVSHTSPFQ
jgi:hypothetical protein